MICLFIIIINMSCITTVDNFLFPQCYPSVCYVIGKSSHAHFIDLRFIGGYIQYNTGKYVDEDDKKNDHADVDMHQLTYTAEATSFFFHIRISVHCAPGDILTAAGGHPIL